MTPNKIISRRTHHGIFFFVKRKIIFPSNFFLETLEILSSNMLLTLLIFVEYIEIWQILKFQFFFLEIIEYRDLIQINV